MFEPVGEGEGAAGLEMAGSVEEESGNVLIVGDGFDRPENVEGLSEMHGFGVHVEKTGGDTSLCGGGVGHFDLYGRDSDADAAGVKLAGEMNAAGAEAAADIENCGARRNGGGLG